MVFLGNCLIIKLFDCLTLHSYYYLLSPALRIFMNTTTAFRLARVSTLSLFIGSLVACGGGGGSSSSSTPAAPVTLSGKVIDGYISGAIVCLDVNSNNKCDSGEPSTTSTAGGAYTLPAYTGSIAGLRVIAEVGENAIDEDDGQKVGAGNTYSLLAPAAASSTVTPLSTMVSATIAAGGGEAQVSIGQALSNVSAQTGIAVEKLVANDYKEKNDVATAKVAQVTATAIAQVTNNLRTNTEIKAAGLSDGDIIKQANQLVQDKVLAQVVSSGKVTETAAVSSAAIKTAVTAAVANAGLSGASLSGSVQNVIAATKSGAGSVISMADLFKAGFVTPQDQSGDYINSAGARYDGSWRGYRNALNVGYLQFDIDTMTEPPPNIEYVLANNKWYVPYQDGEDWTFDGTDWVLRTDIGSSGAKNIKPSFDQNCVIVPVNAKGTITQRYCAVEKKLEGQLMTKFIPSMCTPGSGPAIASSCPTATFPAGSAAYDLTASVTSKLTGTYNGLFGLWATKEGNWSGYCTTENSADCTSSTATVLDFIKWTQGANRVQFIGDGCNIPFNIKSYNESTKKGVINWASNTNEGCTGNFTMSSANVAATSDFEVIRAGGKDVLIVPTPAIYRARNPSDDKPYIVFTVQKSSTGKTGVWNGGYYPVDFKQSIPFTGDPATNTQVMNTVMFDSILKQKGITPYPYKGASSSGKYNGTTSSNPN